MLKNNTAAILITGLVLFAGPAAMAQGIQGKTMVSSTFPSSAVAPVSDFNLDPAWMLEPTLYCMNIDRGRPPVSPKRLALDPSIQELRWTAINGPRRELLEAFVSQQAGSTETAEDAHMARIGGSVATWSEVYSAERQTSRALFRIGGMNVNLIGPESVRR